MNWIFWLGGLLLFGVAAFSIYWAFRSPKFIAKLTAYASRKAWEAVKPVIVKPLPPDDQAAWREAERAGRGDEWRRKRLGLPPKV